MQKTNNEIVKNLFKKFENNFQIPKDKRIIVAMSGGIDSTVVACILHHLGYKVIGLTMKLYEQEGNVKNSKTCCVGVDIFDAQKIAEKMGFPHYVIDYQSRFHAGVIENMVDQYVNGFTPIPCIKCNEELKFNDLIEQAKKLNADYLVTGHYIHKKFENGQYKLFVPEDQKKDQSYFLFSIPNEILNFIDFPLGCLLKAEVREIARFFELPIAEKKESQDICFIPDGDYAKFVKSFSPNTAKKGEIRHVNGDLLGYHAGIIHYTIGQRRGLGISSSEPLYVIKIDAKRNVVYIGEKEFLGIDEIIIHQVNFLPSVAPVPSVTKMIKSDGQPFLEDIYVKLRSTGELLQADLMLVANKDQQANDEDKKFLVKLKTPENAVAPGQACVFYRKEDERIELLGGGWILATNLVSHASQKEDTKKEEAKLSI